MIDDFDFEDNLGDLKEEDENPNSFFPPVNKQGSRLSLNSGVNRNSVMKQNDNNYALPEPVSSNNKFEKPSYPKATNKLASNDFNFGEDDDDDFGLAEVKPVAKPQNNIPKVPSSSNEFPTVAKQNKADDNDDDYMNDFDDFGDSLDKLPPKKPVPAPNKTDPPVFPSPGFTKNSVKKQNSKIGNISIQDMKRLNSKMDQSSDFDDYNDDLSNLNKPASPVPAEKSIMNQKAAMLDKRESNVRPKPPSLKDKLPSPRTKEVIESKDKPVTMRTGPVADPVPQKQNLRLDTQEKERYGFKKDAQVSDNGSVYSSDKDQKESSAFITQPEIKDPSERKSSMNRDLDDNDDEEPTRMKRRKQSMKSIKGYEDEDPDDLHRENENLITQLLEFTSQMDDRMVLLKKSKKVDKQLEDRPDSALKSRKHKLDAMTRKMKLIKSDIDNMQRILDNSYKIDSVTDKENKFKEQEMILNKQNIQLKDYRKVIKDQKKFIREMEQFDNSGGRLDGLNKHFTEAKEQLKQLKQQYTEEDKRLKEQHKEVQTMKMRNRKILDYVQEKKRIEAETGVKQNVSQEDIGVLKNQIEELEDKRRNVGMSILLISI